MQLDSKNIFKKEEKEKAIKKRYGKDVRMSVYYDCEGINLVSMDDLKAYMLDICSNNSRYKLTEHMTNGATGYCTLEYKINGREIKSRFNTFLEAEIAMIDCISEET